MAELKGRLVGFDNEDDKEKEGLQNNEVKLVGKLVDDFGDIDNQKQEEKKKNVFVGKLVEDEQLKTETTPIYITDKDNPENKIKLYVPEDIAQKTTEETNIPTETTEGKYKSITFNEMKDVFRLFDNTPTKDLFDYKPQNITEKERQESLKSIQDKYGYKDRQSVAEIATKGAVQGVYDLMEANAFIWKLASKITKFKKLENASDVAMKFWKDKVNDVNITKEVLENPIETGNYLNLLKPSWLVYNVARMAPGMVASMAVGLGAETKIVSMIKPEKLPFIARTAFNIAKTIGVGSYAGIQEGASTYNTVKELGGTESDAVKAGVLMTGASTYLNYLSLEKLFSFMGDKTASKLLVGMLTEGLTEYMEEPAEGGILATTKSIEYNMDDFKKQIKEGLSVIPPTILTTLITYGIGSIYNYQPKNSKEEKAKNDIIKTIEEHPEDFGNLKEKAKDVVIDENVIKNNVEELKRNVSDEYNKETPKPEIKEEIKVDIKEEVKDNDVENISKETQTPIEETKEYKHIVELAKQMEETKNTLKESENFVNTLQNKIKKGSKSDVFIDYWNNFITYFNFLDNNVLLNFGIFKNLNANKIQEILSEYRNFNASVLNTSNIYIKELADLFDFNNDGKLFKQMSSFALFLENPTKYRDSASKFIDINKAEKARDLIFKIDGIQKQNFSDLTDKIIDAIEEKGVELNPIKKSYIRRELDNDAVFARNNSELLNMYYNKLQLKSVIYTLLENGDIETYKQLILSDIPERVEILKTLFLDNNFVERLKYVAKKFDLPFKDSLFKPEELGYNWSIVNVNEEDFYVNSDYKKSILSSHEKEIETFKRLYDIVSDAMAKGENIQYVPMHRQMPAIYKNILKILEYAITNNDKETINKLKTYTNLNDNLITKLKNAYEQNNTKEINKILLNVKALENDINNIYTSVLKSGYIPRKVSTIISDIEREPYGRMYLYDIFDQLPIQIQMKYTDPYVSSIYHIITTAYRYAERSMIYKLLKADGCFITRAEYDKLTDEQKKFYSSVPTEILQNHPYLSDFYAHNIFISFYSENLARSFENFPMLNSIRKISSKTKVLVDLMFMNPFIMARLNFDQTLVSQPSALPNIFRTIFVDMFTNPKRYYKYYVIATNVGMLTERTERSKLLRKSIEKDINVIGKFASAKENIINLIKYNKQISSNEEETSKKILNFIYNYTIDALKTISFDIIDKGFKVGVAQTIYDRYYKNLNTIKKIEDAMIKHKISYSQINEINDYNNIEINMDEFEKTRHRLSMLLTRKYIQETQVSKIIGEFGNMPHTTSAILKTFFTAMDIRFSYTFALLKGIAKIVSFEPSLWVSEDYVPGDIKSIEFKTKKDNKGVLKTQPKINLTIFNILLSAIAYSLLFSYLPRYRKGYYLRKGYTLTERNVEDDIVFFRLLSTEDLGQYFQDNGNGSFSELVDKYFKELEKGYGFEYYAVRELSRKLQSILNKTQHDFIIEEAMNRIKNSYKVNLTARDLRIAVDKNVVPQDVASAFLKILNKGFGGLLPMYSPFSAMFSISSELSKTGYIKIYDKDGVKIKATYNDDLNTKLSAMLEKYFRNYTFVGNSIRVLSDNKADKMEKIQSVLFTLYFYYVREGKSLTDLISKVHIAQASPQVSYAILKDRNGKDRTITEQGNVYNYLVSLIWADPKYGVGAVQYKRAMKKILIDVSAFGEDTEKELEFIEKSYNNYLKSDKRSIMERVSSYYTMYCNKVLNNDITKEEAIEKMKQEVEKYAKTFLSEYKTLSKSEYESKQDYIIKTIMQYFEKDLNNMLDKMQEIKNNEY